MIPFGSFRIGRILGISIEINYTWFIIFFLITFALAFAYFPALYPQIPVSINLINGLFTSLIFFGSVLFHELMHSYVAIRNGMEIKKITLFIFGGVSQMTDEPQTPSIEFKMAIAGPLSSFGLAFLFGGIFYFVRITGLPVALSAPFGWLSIINAALAIFNMVPGFPLDGGRVLRSILWGIYKNITKATRVASRFGQGFAYFLIFIGLVFIFRGLIDGLWLILIGWFLNNAAQGSYQQLILREALTDVKVEQVMSKDIESVSPGMPLREVVDTYFVKMRSGRFPVVKDGDLVGMVSTKDVEKIPQVEWDTKIVGDVIQPIGDEKVVTPDDEALKALMRMSAQNSNDLLVVYKNKLLGLITRSEILRLIKIKTKLGV